MSYEYESESKLTFGNILMGLLLLGVIVVIGLILFVYFTLTKTNDKHTFTPTSNTPPPQKVERLSPDGRTLPPETPNAQAAQQPNAKDLSLPNKTAADVEREDRERRALAKQQRDAEAEAQAINNGTLAGGAMNGVATNGDGTQKPKPKPKTQPTKPRDENTTAKNDSNNGERELTPTNPVRNNTIAGERELPPINKKREPLGNRTTEQPLQPQPKSNNSGSSRSSGNSGERDLQPVQKRRANTSEIENLF